MLLIVDRAKDTTVKKKPAVAEVRPADERGASRELNVTAQPVDAQQAIAPGGEDRSALADVLARLAHELRTPISAIVTLSELLRCERYGPLGHPKYVEYVDSIRTGADHALAVLAQTLQDAVEADLTGPAIEESVDVRACLEDCLRLVEPDATSAGVVLERAYGVFGIEMIKRSSEFGLGSVFASEFRDVVQEQNVCFSESAAKVVNRVGLDCFRQRASKIRTGASDDLCLSVPLRPASDKSLSEKRLPDAGGADQYEWTKLPLQNLGRFGDC